MAVAVRGYVYECEHLGNGGPALLSLQCFLHFARLIFLLLISPLSPVDTFCFQKGERDSVAGPICYECGCVRSSAPTGVHRSLSTCPQHVYRSSHPCANFFSSFFLGRLIPCDVVLVPCLLRRVSQTRLLRTEGKRCCIPFAALCGRPPSSSFAG